MEIKPPGNFVLANVDVKSGDFLTVLNEGEYRKLPGQEKEVLTFDVKIPSGAEKKLTMNPTSQTRFLTAFGKDSKDWVGKKARVEIINQQVFKEMKNVIYLHPEGGEEIKPEEIEPEGE